MTCLLGGSHGVGFIKREGERPPGNGSVRKPASVVVWWENVSEAKASAAARLFVYVDLLVSVASPVCLLFTLIFRHA